MKKYVVLIAFTLAALSWIAIMPMLAALSVPEVLVKKTDLEPTVTTVESSGTIQTARSQTVSYGYPVMPAEVYVKVGDTVQAGEKLMTVDQAQTAQAFATIQGIQAAGASSATASQTDSDSVSAALSAAQAAGIAGSDPESVAGLLSQYYGSSGSSDSSSSASDSSSQTAGLTDGRADITDMPEVICSSVSGVVSQLGAAAGCFTQATVPLVVIADTSSLQVNAQVDESLVSSVKAGQSVTITGSALNGTYQGKVNQVYPTARKVLVGATSTKTVVDVLIDITNADSQLKPGLNADVSIETATADAIVLPYEAIRQDSRNQEYVFVVRSGRACRQNIVTGTEHADDVEITSGISRGDEVIVSPPSSLQSGQPVRTKAYTG